MTRRPPLRIVSALTDVDINGEVPWVRDIIARFDRPARESGTLLVPNCGYTVLPDLG